MPELIVGRVELLTVRRITGWACDNSDCALPLLIRVRDGQAVLAETQTAPGSPLAAGGSAPASAQPFFLEFEERLDAAKIEHLVVEAARPDDLDWITLSGPTGQAFQYPGVQVSMIPLLESLEKLPSEVPPLLPWMEEFWTDDPDAPIVPAAASRPVFVLGSARSGTSAVSVSLRHATRYRGFKEGHLLEVAIHLADALHGHFAYKDLGLRAKIQRGYHIGRIPPARVVAEMAVFLQRLAAGFTTPYWIDKTPGHRMIASAPLLAQAWPGARFIFMQRRGLENLKSRRQRFQNAFATDCWAWANAMSSWRTVRDALGDRAIEIDQRTLLDQPENCAARIGKLIDLPPEEIQAFGQALREKRPQETDPSHPTIGDIAELGWSADEIETFRTICGPEMEAYGYTYDTRYRL